MDITVSANLVVSIQVLLFSLGVSSPWWSCCQRHHSGEAWWAEWRAGTEARQSCEWCRWTPRYWCWPSGRASRPAGSDPGDGGGAGDSYEGRYELFIALGGKCGESANSDLATRRLTTYSVWHGDGDNLVGHRMDLVKGDQVIDWQLKMKSKNNYEIISFILKSHCFCS